MRGKPPQRHHRTQQVEETLERRRSHGLLAGRVQVVPGDRRTLHDIRRELENRVAKARIARVDDRREQPLDRGPMAARDQPHRVGQIPAVRVEHRIRQPLWMPG